ncbi:MAG: NAD(P)H-hydrate dehydratase [Thermoguttaceae bacterium]|jgi:NAD(P)H-hydrate epimerase|nr:NAD(P)H-hydrate dehydratase [Thermoguttaceae bacterium]
MIDLPLLPLRPPDSHKGDFGLALIVGGSKGMVGAVALAGMAALRGGAGLVRLGVPKPCLEVVASFEPSYMTVALACDRAGRLSFDARQQILQSAAAATVVGMGPGLGRSLSLDRLVPWLYRHVDKPMVVDADALNALASRPEALGQGGGPRILTPHPGEFARLLGVARVPPEQRPPAAVDLAARTGTIVVLKGHRTLVTDGQRQWINNTSGNPGMATGGSGDVLTGLITALACQGLSPFDAARLGVYLHGLAGDLAEAELGQESIIASDLVRFLPNAFRAYRQRFGKGAQPVPRRERRG